MNAKRREFYKRLHAVLITRNGTIYDARGKTTDEVAKRYNDTHKENKNNKEIVGGLLFFVKCGIARKIRVGTVTYWLETGKDVYDLF